MRFSKKYFISIILSLIIQLSFSQTRGLDSIKALLKQPGRADSLRIKNIIDYAFAWPRPAFDEIIPLIDEGCKLAEQNNLTNSLEQLITVKIGYYVRNNRGLEAFAYCQDMIRLGEKTKNPDILGRAYFLRGDIFKNYNILSKAVEEQRKAIEYFKRSKDSDQLANAEYLLGWYSFNNTDYKTALTSFLHAFNAVKQKADPPIGILGEYSGWVGNSYSALKKFDSAIVYRHMSLNYFGSVNDRYGYGDAFRYLGNVYRSMKMYDSAMVNYKKGYELFKQYDIPERKWLLQYFIAETYASQKNFKSSAHELDLLLDSVNGSKDLLSLYLSANLGCKVFEKNNEDKKAIWCFKKYMLFKDSMEQDEQKGALTELDAKLKFEQEENAFKMREAEKEARSAMERDKQALIRNLFIGGFCVVALFLTFVYRNYRQKKKDNHLLKEQKNEIEYQKKEIQDSINYAQNIQAAVLPEKEEISKHFDEFFLLYKPKDVVSGDFYWYSDIRGTNNSVLLAVADCTGHGVPGAFMSMIGSYELNNSVLERKIYKPSEILSQVNVSLKKRLRQTNANYGSRDGMDIALCAFDLSNMTLNYSGANRPLYIIRNSEALEFQATKNAIGGFTPDNKVFEENKIALQKGDCVYLYTDGYSDQFGGEKNKKLTTKNFKALLKQISAKPLNEQHVELENYFSQWKRNFEQLDDVLVIGIRV